MHDLGRKIQIMKPRPALGGRDSKIRRFPGCCGLGFLPASGRPAGGRRFRGAFCPANAAVAGRAFGGETGFWEFGLRRFDPSGPQGSEQLYQFFSTFMTVNAATNPSAGSIYRISAFATPEKMTRLRSYNILLLPEKSTGAE
jgi:hypothetical protein